MISDPDNNGPFRWKQNQLGCRGLGSFGISVRSPGGKVGRSRQLDTSRSSLLLDTPKSRLLTPASGGENRSRTVAKSQTLCRKTTSKLKPLKLFYPASLKGFRTVETSSFENESGKGMLEGVERNNPSGFQELLSSLSCFGAWDYSRV